MNNTHEALAAAEIGLANVLSFTRGGKLPGPTEDASAKRALDMVRAALAAPAPVPAVAPLDTFERYNALREAHATAVSAALPPWWQDFIQRICELPDRNSPEDEPEAMVATARELESCALDAIEAAYRKAPELRAAKLRAAPVAPVPAAAPQEAVPAVQGAAMAAALDHIVRRLQMDVDDGSRPDQWSMEDLIRIAKAALATTPPQECDDKSGRRDAEAREQELQALLVAWSGVAIQSGDWQAPDTPEGERPHRPMCTPLRPREKLRCRSCARLRT